MLITDNTTYSKFCSDLTYINDQKWNATELENVPLAWLNTWRIRSSENRRNSITIYAQFLVRHSYDVNTLNLRYMLQGPTVFSKLKHVSSTR
jgi:hypothetical protein